MFRLHEFNKDLMVSLQYRGVQTNLEEAEELLFPVEQHLCSSTTCTSPNQLTVSQVSRPGKNLQYCTRDSHQQPPVQCNAIQQAQAALVQEGAAFLCSHPTLTKKCHPCSYRRKQKTDIFSESCTYEVNVQKNKIIYCTGQILLNIQGHVLV